MHLTQTNACRRWRPFTLLAHKCRLVKMKTESTACRKRYIFWCADSWLPTKSQVTNCIGRNRFRFQRTSRITSFVFYSFLFFIDSICIRLQSIYIFHWKCFNCTSEWWSKNSIAFSALRKFNFTFLFSLFFCCRLSSHQEEWTKLNHCLSSFHRLFCRFRFLLLSKFKCFFFFQYVFGSNI